jgi:5-methylcytosine-specific restriction endonuclease McrA
MPKCSFEGCNNFTRYTNTTQIYCTKHLARVRRHGYPEIKRDAYRSLEKLPHKYVDTFIKNNYKTMKDSEISEQLSKSGYRGSDQWTVKYRRRKLGLNKYLSGDVLKHKAWIRTQAIKKYGEKCELCGYGLALDTHHIIPKNQGGNHKIDNLMVLCPNCHALLTRGVFKLESRAQLKIIQHKVAELLRSFYLDSIFRDNV